MTSTGDVKDDEMLLSSLLAGDDVGGDLPALLDRFRKDHDSSRVVERLIERTQFPGLDYVYTTHSGATSTLQQEERALPAGCEESSVNALVTLLGVPRSTCTAVVLLHLSGAKADGTRSLGDELVECVDIHHRQRVARIETVAELLRKDPSEAPALQVVDEMTTQASRPRGLLRLLLAAACQDRVTTRSALHVRNMLPQEMNDVTWEKLVQGLAHSQHMWKRREISSALQAIMFLVYNRLEVERADLALLLTALSGMEIDRDVGSVIIAESIALWRIFPSADENWDLSRHPLLVNDDADHSGLLEVVARIKNAKNQELAFLAVGLLMNTAGGEVLRTRGFQIASEANGKFDAFGCLHILMEKMVSRDRMIPTLGFEDLVPYDSQPFVSPSYFETEAQLCELSVSSLAIASVGHEILYASLLVFEEVLLPKMKLPQTSNVARIASLVAAVFQNSPSLSAKVWSDWESNPELPFGRLLDSSYRLAEAALHAALTGFNNRDEVLLGLTPFLQIVSSWVYGDEIVEDVLDKFLPEGLVRTCLDLAKLPGSAETSKSCRATIVSSISTLVSIGCKKDACRDRLRSMLESQEHDHVSGPEALASMISMSSETTIRNVYACLADLADGASVEWLLNAVTAVQLAQTDEGIWRGMFYSGDAEPMARLVLGLLKNLPSLVFDTMEGVAVRVIEILRPALQACIELLDVSRPKQGTFAVAMVVMDGISAALKNLRSIMELRASDRVYMAAAAFLDELVLILTTRLGSAVVFFATYPSMLSIVSSIESTTNEAASAEDLLPHLKRSTAMLEEKLLAQLKILNTIDINFDSFESRGVNMGDKSMCFQASLSAVRLLCWWGKTIEVKGVFSLDLSGSVLVDPTSLEEILVDGPLRFLHCPVPLPQGTSADGSLISVWERLQITPLSLLLGFCRSGHDGVNMALANETLDLLSLLFYTCSPSAERSVVFFRTLNRFSCFSGVVGQFIDALDALGSRKMATQDVLDASVSLRFLRLIGSLLVSGTLSPTQVLQSHCSSSFVAFVSVIKAVLPEILNLSESLGEPSFVCRLRLASGCSFCLGLIWRSSRSGDVASAIDLDALIENKQSFFELLLSVLFDGSSSRLDHFEGREASGRCALVSTFANVFELLATELSWAASDFSPSLSICKAIENVIEGDLRKVTAVAVTFQGMKTAGLFNLLWGGFARNCKGGCKLPDLANRSMLFYALAGPSCHPGTPYFTDSTGRDMQVAQAYTCLFVQEFSDFKELELLNTITHTELVSQSAWGRFFFVLVETISKLRESGTNFAMTHNDFASTYISTLFGVVLAREPVGREIVAATKHTSKEFSWLMEKAWIRSIGLEWWVDTFESTAKLNTGTATKLVSAAENFDLVANNLRITLFLMDAEKAKELNQGQPSRHLQERFRSALFCILEMACKSIMQLARSSEENSVDVAHFRYYFLFLLFAADYVRCFPSLSEKFSAILTEFELLPSLLRFAATLKDTKNQLYITESAMDFFSQLVPLSACQVLDYLAANAVSLAQLSALLVNEPRDGRQKEHPMKKYLDFLVDCIRSTSLTVSGKFHELARAVVQQHIQELLVTLKKCVKVERDFGPQSSRGRSFALTLSLVNEAQSVLSIVAELATVNPRDGEPWQTSQAALAEIIFSTIPVFSTYLAAAGSAREIFVLCDQAESSGAMNVDFCSQLDYLSRLVATGPQNAKHDAIRYTANYVLNVFQPVTDDDERLLKTQGGRLGGQTYSTGSSSASVSDSLEKRCRNGVSNAFSLETEKQAAVSLFHAFSFLKKIHPAQDAFVMFAAENLRSVHPFELVKPGMCIAFRPPGTHDVHCGRVMASNGLKLTWQAQRVWPLPPTTEEIEIEISASQFLGVQDPEKRIALVPRTEAPDSSTELETLTGKPASTAHFVLCLRWCRYFFNELKSGFGGIGDEKFVKRFAELTSGLLSIELSVHNHIASSVASSSLDCQLLDLYGESHEIQRVPGSSTENGLEGKLKPLLSKGSWDSARFHLRAYLKRALERLADENKRESPRSITMGIATPFR